MQQTLLQPQRPQPQQQVPLQQPLTPQPDVGDRLVEDIRKCTLAMNRISDADVYPQDYGVERVPGWFISRESMEAWKGIFQNGDRYRWSLAMKCGEESMSWVPHVVAVARWFYNNYHDRLLRKELS